jgi:DNA topoisomerase-3
MRLFIAEKPSLARAIAGGLGTITDKSETHIEVGSDIVTWCFGHILEQAPPHAYDPSLKNWAMDPLPIRIPLDGWKLNVVDKAKRQYEAIGKLLRMADTVVNAGDPDREGQMLVDEVLEAHGWTGTTERLLVANATPSGVREAMKKLRPNADFRPLYEAAMCRARADWLVGMNFSRVVTLNIKHAQPGQLGPLVSIGRVQTPTLSLVVQRDRSIENHTAKHYYPLHAHVQTTQGGFVAVHDPKENRITDPKIAKQIAATLRGKSVAITMQNRQEKSNAPLPFILSTFSAACEDAFGWSAKESLEVLQSLYEKQLVTYPRTDCPYLPSDHAPQARRIAEAIAKTGLLPSRVDELLPLMSPKPEIYNDAKVEEHHGVIPTSRMPDESLPPKLRDAWRLVARRFLQTLLPALIKDVTEASFVHEERKFTSRGETELNTSASWKVFEPPKEKREDVPPLRLNGVVSQGDVRDVEIKKGTTSPPKRYTEATLIADMKTVGKYVEDERLKAILKETSGIGTAATHAAIIETLKSRGYIKLEGSGKAKNIISTGFGRYLIDNLPKALHDPGITAAWEDMLNRIAKREADPGAFMTKIDAFVAKYVEHMKQAVLGPLPNDAPRGKEPRGGGADRAKATPFRRDGASSGRSPSGSGAGAKKWSPGGAKRKKA